MANMYKYYTELYSDEHMYYACELAWMYNLYPPIPFDDKIKKAVDRKIHSCIKKYLKDNNLFFNPIYCMCSKGLKKVYPEEIYTPVISIYGEQIKDVWRIKK